MHFFAMSTMYFSFISYLKKNVFFIFFVGDLNHFVVSILVHLHNRLPFFIYFGRFKSIKFSK